METIAATALFAIPALAAAAIVANQRSLLAMAKWGSNQSPEFLRMLGFPTGQTPHQSTVARLFRRLDPATAIVVLRTLR